jgi:hypothetical protein
MITLFRRLRQRLLTENKFSKYILYAIGEIILVVFGILIALQINNWNENRKNKAIEYDYYCQLLNDIDLDKIQLEALTKEAEQSVEIGKQLIKDLHTLKKGKNEMMADYIKTIRSNSYLPTNVTYTDLKSSGNLSLLKNKVLKQKLIQYQSEIENIAGTLEANRTYRMDKVMVGWDNVLELGWQAPSISGGLNIDEELLKLLPNNQWHLDPQSAYFQKYQEVIFISITIAQREIELFKIIGKKMKPLYNELYTLCNT